MYPIKWHHIDILVLSFKILRTFSHQMSMTLEMYIYLKILFFSIIFILSFIFLKQLFKNVFR